MKNENMQSLTRRALSAAAAASLCLTPVLAGAETANSALVVGGALNLRETASLDAKVLGQYPTGTLVEIREKGNEWSKVTVNGKTGYMMTRYLSQSEKNVSATVRTNTGIGLNLREEPSLSGLILTSYKPGTQVTVLQKGHTWSRVQVDGKVGFMSTAYLNFGGGSSGFRFGFGAFLSLGFRSGLLRAFVDDGRFAQAQFRQQFRNAFGRLRTGAQPEFHAVGFDDDAFGVIRRQQRVVRTDAFDETNVARATLICYNDFVKGRAFRTTASKSDTN